MSIFSRIRNKFRRKKHEVSDLDSLTKKLPPAAEEQRATQTQERKIHLDNVKAKLDLILIDLDNVKTQNQMMNERLKNMEKTLADMRGIKYY
ncbi:MAG: hypothetical protein ISS48_04510 [Candidatus Aenigmarchaeota archaeon]|nr:hypothetical protein [Candidatus Aenigmarchaeota archaeon]